MPSPTPWHLHAGTNLRAIGCYLCYEAGQVLLKGFTQSWFDAIEARQADIGASLEKPMNTLVLFRLNYVSSPPLYSRPPSRGGTSQGSRPSSAAYERPLSAMKKDRLRVPTGGAAMIAGRKIEDVHPTIQQSTFGASWAAPAL
jgi:hypothetical protein